MTVAAETELVIFDLDGVLVDSEIVMARLLTERLRTAGIAIDTPTLIRRFHYTPIETIPKRLGREQGVTVADDLVADLWEVYYRVLETELNAIAGAEETVAALGLPKCIASGSRPENLRWKLQHVGLLDHFEPALFSAFDVPHGKPAPDVFLHAAARMKARPESCLVIEDAVVGVQAARAAGMPVLGFAGGGHWYPGMEESLAAAGADAVLSDLRDLAGMIADRVEAGRTGPHENGTALA